MAASAQPMRWVVCSMATTRFSLMISPRTRNASSSIRSIWRSASARLATPWYSMMTPFLAGSSGTA